MVQTGVQRPRKPIAVGGGGGARWFSSDAGTAIDMVTKDSPSTAPTIGHTPSPITSPAPTPIQEQAMEDNPDKAPTSGLAPNPTTDPAPTPVRETGTGTLGAHLGTEKEGICVGEAYTKSPKSPFSLWGHEKTF